MNRDAPNGSSDEPAGSGKKGGQPAAGIALAVLLNLLIGCASETKHHWLNFFFDGVPNPGATNAPAAYAEEGGVTPTNAAAAAVFAKPAAPHTLHPPFHDGACTE